MKRTRPPHPRDRKHRQRLAADQGETVLLYGLHTVAAALQNPRRVLHRLRATANAVDRLKALAGEPWPLEPEIVIPREIDRLLAADAVHQGVLLETEPLAPLGMQDFAAGRLLVLLDQVTDPHNVGAILRSATAFGADAVITTARHSPLESGVLAKAASGALDMIPYVTVKNLARALEEIGSLGYTRIGLDSAGTSDLDAIAVTGPIAVVLGAEGKGLRQLTRETCDVVARLDMPGAIKSLNVSNAAAITLFALSRKLAR